VNVLIKTGTSDVPIWAAVRASSAAPGYFNDFLLDDMVHQDGGILTNNATQIAIHEAHR
jgi:calcium-independent phospholipase A2-gamma